MLAHLPCAGEQLKLKLVVPPAAVWVPGITYWPLIDSWNSLVCCILSPSGKKRVVPVNLE
jgi:hypothetical protein